MTSTSALAEVLVEPIGACSRKTGFVISEIMYKPVAGSQLEFVEIYNSNPFEEEIGEYRLSGEIDFTFPAGTILDGESYLIVAKDAAAFQAEYNLSGVQVFEYGELDGGNSLASSGSLRLVNSSNGRILEVEYDNDGPWPVAANGAGHSLVLARPSYGENDPQAWEASDVVGGSPGAGDTYGEAALRNVVINEVLAHTDDPQLDTIELYNHSNVSVDLSGCILSDDAELNKYTIPGGTTIPARGYVIFDQVQMGFSLNTSGEAIYFRNAAGTCMIDVLKFGGQENGVSLGRYPDGGAEFHRMASLTLGSANGARRIDDLVINEVMYDPISGEDNDEFVELYNQGSSTIDLSGWRLRGGVSYTFPEGAQIAANSYVVVARDAVRLQTNYTQLNAANTYGDFNGKLGNGGDRVTLDKPDEITDFTDPENPATTLIHITVDDFTYGTGGQWPVWAKGGGSSMERVDSRSNPRRPTAWADSDETAKATWTDISVTGLLELGANSANRIDGGLQGAGESLLDNVEVTSSGTNYVDNSTFNNLNDWVIRGAYERSSIDSNGFSGSCLHIRGSTRFDTGANKFSGSLSSTLSSGSTATISAKAKWQKGYPWLYLRLNGSYLEASVKLDVPLNLGTPGQENSRAVANNAPAIDEVIHSPVVPTAGQNVVVSARVEDPDGLDTLTTRYRTDPSTSYVSVNMNDSGNSGDEVAGDGIYSAIIPAQTANTLVAFQVLATDSAGSSQRVFPGNTPENSSHTRECLVRFGDATRSSSFGTYRMWFTSAAITDWETRLALSNEPIEGTFVYNDNRVIYNFRAHYTGGVYKQGYGSPLNDSNYTMDMPLDDQLLGTDNFNKLHATGQNPFEDKFFTREQAVFEVARQLKQPWLYRRYVNVYVNGVARKEGWLMEDTQVPGSEFIEQYWPDDADGNLHKISLWFEFTDFSTATGVELNDQRKSNAQLLPEYNAAGALHAPRYRWNWAPRAYGKRGNNDFSSVFELVEAANPGADMTERLLEVADMEEWMRVWAARHASGDVDNFGRDLGQNFYMYKPTEGRAALLIWDAGHIFGNAASMLPGRGLFPDLREPNGGNDSVTYAIFQNPTFRRMYLRAYKEIAYGAFEASQMNNWLDVRYDAFVADGLTAAIDPDTTFSHDDNGRGERYDGLDSEGGITSFTGSLKNWVAVARSGILTQVAQQDVTSFTLTSPTSVTSSSNTITITGSAPVEMATMTFNGVEYPLTWTTTTNWTIDFVVNESSTTIDLQGLDVYGEPLAGMSATISVTVTASLDDPEGAVVINEILYNPTVSGGEFVELYNRSTTTAFDLTGWRVNGLGHTFTGTIIAPGGYLVIDDFSGKLDQDGETLTLYRPTGVDTESVVDQVRYEAVAPWATTPAGSSLQLMDSDQDNRRAALWAVADGLAIPPAGETLVDWGETWKYREKVNLDGTGWETASYDDTNPAWPSGLGAFGEDTDPLPHAIQTALSAPKFGGALTCYFRKTINFTGVAGASLKFTTMVDDGFVVYVDGVPVHRLRMAAGTPTYTTLATGLVGDAAEESSSVFDLNLQPGTHVIAVEVHQINDGSSDVVFDMKVETDYSSFSTDVATPGVANSVSYLNADIPELWLNEVMPAPLSGSAWVELYNAGSTGLSLDGYTLSDDYGDLDMWQLSSETTIEPGAFLQISLRGTLSSGSMVLSRDVNGSPEVIDYLNYGTVASGWSYGNYPDGDPCSRLAMYLATPGAANTNESAPLDAQINEWMADNSVTLADAADGDFEDWFEIYNPTSEPIDLGGYFLTDDLTDPYQFEIPANGKYTIPAYGFLLVWADKEPEQNDLDASALHADFALSKSGEVIALVASDGNVIDSVTFDAQVTDQSQGRMLDGGSTITDMESTPGAANQVVNTAPVLNAIVDVWYYPGETLSFTVTATDAESAFQTLTYYLEAGAPSGAAITPSGSFSWSIPTDQAPSNWSTTVRVTDNGTPDMSDTEAFTVHVNALPAAESSLAASGDAFTLSIETVPGRDYYLYYKDALSDLQWLQLGDAEAGDGSVLEWEIPITDVPERFFRLSID